MFGGHDGFDYLDDTWGWDGNEWGEVQPFPPVPPARLGHAMAYDHYHAQVVMFGGTNGSSNFGGTWTLGEPYNIPPGARELGDFNSDGCTDFADFIFLLENWGEDIDGEPMGFEDFLALLENWGHGC